MKCRIHDRCVKSIFGGIDYEVKTTQRCTNCEVRTTQRLRSENNAVRNQLVRPKKKYAIKRHADNAKSKASLTQRDCILHHIHCKSCLAYKCNVLAVALLILWYSLIFGCVTLNRLIVSILLLRNIHRIRHA